MSERILFVGGSLDGQRLATSEYGVPPLAAAISVKSMHDELILAQLSIAQARSTQHGLDGEEVYIREVMLSSDGKMLQLFLLRSIGRNNLVSVLVENYRKAL